MKIFDRSLTGTSSSETGRAQETQSVSRAGTGKSPTRGVDGSNDRVEFSGSLSRLSHTLNTFETSRAGRVEALAAQYRSGNYQPNSAATSKGLVADAMSGGLQAGLE